MAFCIYRYRHQAGRKAAYEPENKKLEVWLTVGTTLGVAGMLAPGLFVWNQFVTVPEEAVAIEAVGAQWQWTFRLPGKDGALGISNPKSGNYANPFGLRATDPNGQDATLAEVGELNLQRDTPVKVLTRSKYVLHDLYVPQFP